MQPGSRSQPVRGTPPTVLSFACSVLLYPLPGAPFPGACENRGDTRLSPVTSQTLSLSFFSLGSDHLATKMSQNTSAPSLMSLVLHVLLLWAQGPRDYFGLVSVGPTMHCARGSPNSSPT